MKKPERIQEPRLQSGQIEFLRTYCKEGFIDHWMGDSAHNPDNPTTSRQVVNSIVSSFRLNGKEWVDRREMKEFIPGLIATYKEHFTAQEIWDFATQTTQPHE